MGQKQIEETAHQHAPHNGQRVEIDANKMIRLLQKQRAEFQNQLDMMAIMLEEKDEQIALLLRQLEEKS